MQIKMDNTDTQSIAEAVVNLLIPVLKDHLVTMIAGGTAVADQLPPCFATDDDLLDQAQTANMVCMSEAWLEKKRCAGGGISFVKIGSKVRYKRKDVTDYIASHTFNNTCESTFDQI
ncbi:MAG: helix-turn-helix domain-containing protein [Geobacteraceae bacterium]|nr:helix-turn-helix domain-containing protein [Geobacteraceae bacterium]NTW79212.1 helix-turn-helix domain-containing protein [Geobacteraceae bacterium]